MLVRPYRNGDAPILARIFLRSVRELARAKYSEEQVLAWAPAIPDANRWDARMRESETLVTEDAGEPVAFITFERDGHLTMLYRSPDAPARTATDALYRAAEEQAITLGIPLFHTEASLLAEPFFTRHGYHLDRRESVERNGVLLPRARMSKILPITAESARPDRSPTD